MITIQEYFHDSVVNFGYAPTAADNDAADDLLTRANKLIEDFGEDLVLRSGHRTRAKTLALIAAGYKAALGGKHETAQAVDIADPNNLLDAWLTDAKLEAYGLYREAPSATPTWVHVQTVAPKSGHRTFIP